MMTGRQGRATFQFLPDEARSLPPPKLTDPRLAFVGFLGYCSGLIDNAIRRRPVLSADKKTYGEVFEEFHPVR
uniref:NADH:ubiquinone oxidoreductase subunit C2 n=1 Tax=Bos mutus grunniens TaxID=30521 RepID=A0A8B9Y904_BOSMU